MFSLKSMTKLEDLTVFLGYGGLRGCGLGDRVVWLGQLSTVGLLVVPSWGRLVDARKVVLDP
jgi:hypothetical protein